jgi:hypothetical protein
MSYVKVEELELLSFFAVEPVRADKDAPWPYNEFTYGVAAGPFSVEFKIYPACRELSLSVCLDGAELYSFAAVMIKDVRYHNQPDREVLEIVVSERESIWFRLRPSMFIAQNLASEP